MYPKRQACFASLRFRILLLGTALGLTAIGFCMLAITQADSATTRKLVTQAFSFFIGIFLCSLLSVWDCRRLLRFTPYLYLASVCLLLCVLLFGIGKNQSGALSWLRFGSIGIQPSEPIKVVFAMVLSTQLARHKEAGTLNNTKNLLALFGLCAIPILLVVLQNDTGTALVFFFMFCCMLVAAGLSKTYILIFLGLLLLLLPLGWLCLAPYQKNRILVFLNPEADPFGAGYQVLMSKTAIGSGGLFGRGILKGPLHRLGLLPEHDTDFVFSVIGEEFGFLGTVLAAFLLFFLVWQILLIARRTKDSASRILAVGLFAMFLFHTVENIGASIGLLPVTGIPLPFLSYGGSALITNYFALGLLLNIDKTANANCF